MSNSTQKISVMEKIGYSLGDLAANLIFQTLMTFLAFFYTDVYKIPPATASFIIFFGGMFGAFFNPVMGIIADRTTTRWGKFRPWILWTAVPFGAMAILAFSTPDFSPSGKVACAFITYLLLVVVYVVFFIITFLTTKERIIPKPEQKSTIKEYIKDLVKNRPRIVMTLVLCQGDIV